MAFFRLTPHRARPSGRHRQVMRWSRIVRWICGGSLVVILTVMALTYGMWAVWLSLLAIGVTVVALMVDDPEGHSP